MTRGEAQQVIAEFLMERVRADHYPSTTQMAMIEQLIQRDKVPEYLDILIEKVAADAWPSLDLLRRIMRVAETLPVSEQRR
jgi:urease gamma subunit